MIRQIFTIFTIFASLILAGCGASNSLNISRTYGVLPPAKPYVAPGVGAKDELKDSNAKLMFERVMKIPVDCSAGSKGTSINIDGVLYNADTVLELCLKRNLLDTKIGIKKVYIHRVLDARLDSLVLSYPYGKTNIVYTPSFSLEELYYRFLVQELNSRGILVVDEPTPYALRLDFSIIKLVGAYSAKSRVLELALAGRLSVEGRRTSQSEGILTTASAFGVCSATQCNADFYVSLILKQAAAKTAKHIVTLAK